MLDPQNLFDETWRNRNLEIGMLKLSNVASFSNSNRNLESDLLKSSVLSGGS